MLDLTQARPVVTTGTRPIVIAANLAAGHAALRAAGIDPDDPRAYVAILTPVSAPLSSVMRAPQVPVLDVFPWGELEPGRYLKATVDFLIGRGFAGIRGRGDDVEDKSTRGPREPRPKPAPAPRPAAA